MNNQTKPNPHATGLLLAWVFMSSSMLMMTALKRDSERKNSLPLSEKAISTLQTLSPEFAAAAKQATANHLMPLIEEELEQQAALLTKPATAEFETAIPGY